MFQWFITRNEPFIFLNQSCLQPGFDPQGGEQPFEICAFYSWLRILSGYAAALPSRWGSFPPSSLKAWRRALGKQSKAILQMIPSGFKFCGVKTSEVASSEEGTALGEGDVPSLGLLDVPPLTWLQEGHTPAH